MISEVSREPATTPTTTAARSGAATSAIGRCSATRGSYDAPASARAVWRGATARCPNCCGAAATTNGSASAWFAFTRNHATS
jgi:hypothetical protein